MKKGFSFASKVVKITRTTGSSFPEMTISVTKDKFSLNEEALKLMGLNAGDKVVMFDMNQGAEPEDLLPTREGRFYIAKNDFNDEKRGLIGKTGGFNYTGIWSAILVGQPNVLGKSNNDLKQMGLVIETVSESGFTAVKGTKRFNVEIVPFVDEKGNDTFDIGADEKKAIFLLKNFREVEFDYNDEEESVEETVEETVTE